MKQIQNIIKIEELYFLITFFHNLILTETFTTRWASAEKLIPLWVILIHTPPHCHQLIPIRELLHISMLYRRKIPSQNSRGKLQMWSPFKWNTILSCRKFPWQKRTIVLLRTKIQALSKSMWIKYNKQELIHLPLNPNCNKSIKNFLKKKRELNRFNKRFNLFWNSWKGWNIRKNKLSNRTTF